MHFICQGRDFHTALPLLLDNLTDGYIAYLHVTKFSTISLYLTKLYVT